MARYYIDKTGVDNASRNGLSVAAAWASLSYACTRVAASAGHVIQVNTGTYIETTVSSLPVGVSIEGENRYSSIIKSTITSTYTISLTSGSSNTNGNQHISNLRIESNTAYASYAAIGVIKRGNVEIYNCDIRNFNYYAIALHNGEQTGSYAVGNKVHDCTINNSGGYIGVYGSGGDTKGALDILSQDGLLVYNNIIVLARPDGKNGNCIDGVEGFIKNMKVYNNTLTKTFVYGVTAWDFCIEIWNWEGGNEIYNNVITGSIDVQHGSKGSSKSGSCASF